MQLREEGHATQAKLVLLIVFPAGQRAHLLVISHLIQLFNEAGQEIQVFDRLQVKVAGQHPAEFAGFMK